ncbi:hypothetical protein GDO78_022697 [Eleutherodactylus coqui]|uniref:Uncharacterized protein n=1 Tax=Eleutherodactylus coqui TaxID=57060 RepID=A0A8J6AZL2_ELECQ|nr:hypothetical protein GDO78_022697 [Eleutherodactylus coqui]
MSTGQSWGFVTVSEGTGIRKSDPSMCLYGTELSPSTLCRTERYTVSPPTYNDTIQLKKRIVHLEGIEKGIGYTKWSLLILLTKCGSTVRTPPLPQGKTEQDSKREEKDGTEDPQAGEGVLQNTDPAMIQTEYTMLDKVI